MAKKNAVAQMAIEGDLTIFTANEVRGRLLETIAQGREAEIDLTRVAEFDSAGVQLMLAAKKEAAERGVALRFIGHSPAVLDVLDLCDLVGVLGDPVPIRTETMETAS